MRRWAEYLDPTCNNPWLNQVDSLTNEPPERTAGGVAQQSMFHSLLALMLRSIRIENHMRLLQMENALQHLDRGRDDLTRQRNRLRQEEIIEEIELMALS
jgi:F-type H+-transporting ATPase subunit gamma